MDTKNAANENNNQSKNDSAKTNNNGYPSVQEMVDRTIDNLLAEHPGELVRTGSPHIVIFNSNYDIFNPISSLKSSFHPKTSNLKHI